MNTKARKTRPAIRWIIDGWRYWDKTNGHSYHLSRVTHVTTGRSLILEECEGNTRCFIMKAERANGSEDHRWQLIHTSPIQEVSYREWRRMLNNYAHAPVNQYARKNGVTENITHKLINQLRRAKK